MQARDLLNADMATIAALLRRGFDWWIAELRAMLPEGMRARGRHGNAIAVLGRSGLLVAADGQPLIDTGAGVQRQGPLAVDAGLALLRAIDAPPVAGADLARLVALEAERFMPLPQHQMLVAHHREAGAGGRLHIAALPRHAGEQLLEQAHRAGLSPASVGLEDGGLVDPRFDFLPAMRAAGLVPPRPGLSRWWYAVGFLFVLNAALVVWRDAAETQNLRNLVEAQQPSVQVAQRIARTMQRSQRLAREAVERRGEGGPLAVLALVSRILPEGAWVQRLAWEGSRLRLTGYQPQGTRLAEALRRSGGFAAVRAGQADDLAATPAGQPFDVELVLHASARGVGG